MTELLETRPPATGRDARGTFDWVLLASCGACLSFLIVTLGVSFGVDYLQRQEHGFQLEERSIDDSPLGLRAYAAWDGVWYARIAARGYGPDKDRATELAFFPAYPLLASGLMRLTGLGVYESLMAVSQTAFLASCILFVVYSRRGAAGGEPAAARGAYFALLALCLWPAGVFFRMAYSESLFLLLSLAALYGMRCGWHGLAVAAIIGLATAARPTGVALVVVHALDIWQQSQTYGQFLRRAAWRLPVSCWGLAAWMAWQWGAYGDPFAFAGMLEDFNMRPRGTALAWLKSFVSFEPLWSVYVPGSRVAWEASEPIGNPLFSLQFANPIYFSLALGLVVLGAHKKWLNTREWVLGLLLLLIPYVMKGDVAGMTGQARYSAVVFPVYIVIGQALARMPVPISGSLLGLSGFCLGIYAGLFAAWYRIF